MDHRELNQKVENRFFDILAHSVRRQILLWIDEVGYLYYSDFKELALSTGTLYHHLKVLKPYLQQDEEKRYSLSEEGKEAILILKKMHAESQDFGLFRTPKQIQSIFRIIERQPIIFSLISGVALLLATVLGLEFRILLLGPFFLTDTNNSVLMGLLGLCTWLFCIFGMYTILRKLNEPLVPTQVYFSRAMLATILPSLFQIIIWGVDNVLSLKIGQIEFLILLGQVGSQIWCIAILTLALTSSLDITLDRSFVSSLLACYIILLVILLR